MSALIVTSERTTASRSGPSKRQRAHPPAPPGLRLPHRLVGVERPGRGQVGGMPGERERPALPGRDLEVGHGGEALAPERQVGGEREGLGPRHRVDPVRGSAHPGDHRAVVHSHHQLHPHRHGAPAADDLADQDRRALALGHAVDHRHRAVGGLEVRLEDQGAVAVPAARGSAAVAGGQAEPAVLGAAQQGREAGGRVEAGQAEPVDGAAARDQGRGLAVADQRVVLDGVGHWYGWGYGRGRSIDLPRATC